MKKEQLTIKDQDILFVYKKLNNWMNLAYVDCKQCMEKLIEIDKRYNSSEEYLNKSIQNIDNEINALNKKINQIKTQKKDLQHKLDIKTSAKKCENCEHDCLGCDKEQSHLLYRNNDGTWFCEDWEEIEDK